MFRVYHQSTVAGGVSAASRLRVQHRRQKHTAVLHLLQHTGCIQQQRGATSLPHRLRHCCCGMLDGYVRQPSLLSRSWSPEAHSQRLKLGRAAEGCEKLEEVREEGRDEAERTAGRGR